MLQANTHAVIHLEGVRRSIILLVKTPSWCNPYCMVITKNKVPNIRSGTKTLHLPSVAHIMKAIPQDCSVFVQRTPLGDSITSCILACTFATPKLGTDNHSSAGHTHAPRLGLLLLSQSPQAASIPDQPFKHISHQNNHNDAASFRGLFSPGRGRPWRQSQQSPPHRRAPVLH